jgi:SH3-like domain-containing protein
MKFSSQRGLHRIRCKQPDFTGWIQQVCFFGVDEEWCKQPDFTGWIQQVCFFGVDEEGVRKPILQGEFN